MTCLCKREGWGGGGAVSDRLCSIRKESLTKRMRAHGEETKNASVRRRA